MEIASGVAIYRVPAALAGEGLTMNDAGPNRLGAPPVVFLSYASEDKPLARRIAARLFEAGMEVFFDDWEIRAGESIREKIDASLGKCTHFVVLLTPNSIGKSWVRAEMDAAFVMKLDGWCRFIPLRHDLRLEQLPPLLRGIMSPQIREFDSDIAKLIEDILDIDRRPSQRARNADSAFRASEMGLSPAAAEIVGLIVRKSRHGMRFDPQLSAEQVKAGTNLSDDVITEAAEELIERGVVEDSSEVRRRPLGFLRLLPHDSLFALYDGFFMEWNPEEDALRIAADLVNERRVDKQIKPQELADRYSWEPRRLNPAINHLALLGAVKVLHAVGTAPYCCAVFWATSKTRRLLREREPPFAARERLRAKRGEILEVAERCKTFDLRLFGSSARGDRAAQSDIDIVVKLKPGATLFDLARLEEELTGLLGYGVDVVDEESLRPSVREKVLAEATPI